LGDLREKIFSQAVESALSRVRKEMCDKYKPKKENRFFSNGITYEIGAGKLADGGVQFEISSKIPVEVILRKGMNVRYFRDVRDLMNKGFKKPVDTRMENIIRSTTINEIKERDYVKCVFFYKNSELYTDAEVDKTVKAASAGKIDLSDITGVPTLPGRAVIYLISTHVYNMADRNIADLLKANDAVIKKYADILKQPPVTVAPKAKKSQKPKGKKSAPKVKKPQKSKAKKSAPKKGKK
jgi:hypothetical protein